MWSELLNQADVKSFWLGVVGSILATAIVGTIGFAFKSTFESWRRRWDNGRVNSERFEEALNKAGPFTLFAYGVAQGGALKLVFFGMAFALIGALVDGVFFPFGGLLYALAPLFAVEAVRWMNKIEKAALLILDS